MLEVFLIWRNICFSMSFCHDCYEQKEAIFKHTSVLPKAPPEQHLLLHALHVSEFGYSLQVFEQDFVHTIVSALSRSKHHPGFSSVPRHALQVTEFVLSIHLKEQQ